jgi:hypothetical protein
VVLETCACVRCRGGGVETKPRSMAHAHKSAARRPQTRSFGLDPEVVKKKEVITVPRSLLHGIVFLKC